MTSPHRKWPPRLRSLLGKELARQGLGAIPKGLTIRYSQSRIQGGCSTIEIRHSPAETERMSVHDHVHDFDGGEDSISRFLDVAVLHARRMIRRDARADALRADGHDPRKPPFHAVEADPLTALAFHLVEAGRAGIDGEVRVINGLLEIDAVNLTIDGMSVRLVKPGYLRIEIEGEWPETIIGVMVDRPLGDTIRLPSCGNPELDAAAAAMTVMRGQISPGTQGRKLILTLDRAPAVFLARTPASEDGSWKALLPPPEA